MKQLFILLLCVGCTLPATSMAQKMYMESGVIILDLTDLPPNAITSVHKYVGFTPDASVLGTENSELGAINATMFHKIEIDAADATASRTAWVDAFNLCKSKGTNWRLPTQRELQVIFIFKPAIDSLQGGTSTFDSTYGYYWTATENSQVGNASWYVKFVDGMTSTQGKTVTNLVRCIREVD